MQGRTGAVLVSVLLVVAAGSAVIFTASAAPDAVGADGVLQQTGNETAGNETGENETAVNETAVNETAVNETAVNETAVNETAEDVEVVGNISLDNESTAEPTGNVTEANASVVFEDQTSNGSVVVVANVTVPEGGFVAIHDGSLFEGEAVASVIGVSEYLESGSHENVSVRLYENVFGANFTQDALNGTSELVAMPHLDTNGNETYDFVATNGSDDGPYVDADGEAIIDEATITLEEEAEPDVGADDETTTAEPGDGEGLIIVGNISIGEDTPEPSDEAAQENESVADEPATTVTVENETMENETMDDEPAENVTAGNETLDGEGIGNETLENETVQNETADG